MKLTDLPGYVDPIALPEIPGAYMPSDFTWERVGSPEEIQALLAEGDSAMLQVLLDKGCIVDQEGGAFDSVDMATQAPARKHRLVAAFINATISGGVPLVLPESGKSSQSEKSGKND